VIFLQDRLAESSGVLVVGLVVHVGRVRCRRQVPLPVGVFAIVFSDLAVVLRRAYCHPETAVS